MKWGKGNRRRFYGLVLFIITLFTTANLCYGSVRNVILMIPDGMSNAAVTLTRWYNDGKPLAMDEIACGSVKTHSADAPIADSAPAATAYATGFKSHTGYIGVLPDEVTIPGVAPINPTDARKPVATVLEAARLEGKSTGLVFTCEAPHATPASFAAHYPDRRNYDDILEQMVYQNMDVVLGGGAYFLTPEGRKDKEDLVRALKSLGYDYVTTPQQLRNSSASKIWGAFAPKDLAYDFDRDPEKEPSLAEMTEKAIEVLSKNPNGFFLMVEGSKIDWASHANDPIGVISDTLAFDKAVKVALDFAKRSKDTIVIVVADHANGGISIGDRASSSNYDKLKLEEIIGPLKKAKLTGEGVEKRLSPDKSNIREVMSKFYGIDDLTDEELLAIKEARSGSLNYVVGPMISKRAHIGWTTNGHTGDDVTLYVYAPHGNRPTGVIDNTDIAKYIESSLGLDLKEASQRLFVPVTESLFKGLASVSVDNADPNNPVLVIVREGVEIRFPVNKNFLTITRNPNWRIILDGVTVYNGKTWFVPKIGIELLIGRLSKDYGRTVVLAFDTTGRLAF
ncbi:MAG: alkaline phosphatase [Syntrophobacterales bacterium]|nr:alkaline phosphatase [Syntrophobacterales bacterium]